MTRRINIPGLVIGTELGHGAHSTVYLATQGTTACAVKVPRVRGRWTRWVYREAVALARVRHPALPAVIEVGEADGLPYLVMELVEGVTLADRLERGPLAEGEVVHLAIELADALASVHDAGLVHRDVKPRNIIVEPSGRVRLVDFGFASAMDVASSAADPAGTPGYAAPEQFLSPGTVDGRADLYALGRVMVECLRDRSGPRPEVACDPALRATVDTLLADDPADRYSSARGLSAELMTIRDGLPRQGPDAYKSLGRARTVVGREGELERLVAAWRDTGAKGGSTIVVRGRRGSGKTHLLAAMAARARAISGAQAALVEVRCREGDAPLATLRRLLEAFVGAADSIVGGTRVERERALRAAAVDDLDAFATLIAPMLTGVLGERSRVPSASSDAFSESAAEIVVRLARQVGGVLLLVDDIQWIDPASRDVLARVAHRVHEAPILLVVGEREAEHSVAEAFSRSGHGRTSIFDLHPLTERQVGALIEAHLGQKVSDRALFGRVAAMGDGTPLGTMEVLGAFLDAGAVRPQAGSWTFDVARAERVALPQGALALLGHRVGDVPPATRRVLEAAATLGACFEAGVLASVVGMDAADLEYGLADGRRSGLIERDVGDSHRFVHDSLREMLAGSLSAIERRRLNQRIAEVLDARNDGTLEALCAKAIHYAAGEVEKTPQAAYRAAWDAASAALERFDNAMALRFLGLARSAAEKGSVPCDYAFFRSLGEAHLRVGALDESLGSFESALERAPDQRSRALVLGRIAWVHQTRAEPELAWKSLALAFQALGASIPSDTAQSAVSTVARITRAGLRKASPRRSAVSSDDIQLLCDFHYQNSRLGLEYGKPLRLVQSAFEARSLSVRLGPSNAQVRAMAIYGFVLSATGARSAGGREIERAEAMAESLGDPVSRTFCVQMRSMAAGFSGRFDRMLELTTECLRSHGHWLELNTYCEHAANADFIEALRGHAVEGWPWISGALDRVRRAGHEPRGATSVIIHRSRSALAALGRSIDEDPWLANQFESIATRGDESRGLYHLVSWGPRARFLVETGRLGSDLDDLVRSFEREGHNPRATHPMVAEYYVAVVHGRIHQCLHSPSGGRANHVAALRRAVTDLRAAAKIPLLEAHLLLANGHLAWFDGSPSKAMRIFAKAEAIADQESCSWVLYGIARARAHMLLEQGRVDAARDQARVAEMLALAHGAEPRARWIREELGLPAPAPPPRPSVRSSGSSASHRARRQLASLLHVVGAPHPGVHATQHATTILDNLLRDLGAERGLLWFQPDATASAGVLLGRNRAGETCSEAKGWRDALIRGVRTRGQAWPPQGDASASLRGLDPTIDVPRVLVFPLFLYDDAVGAVCLERDPSHPPFSIEDRELLDLVSHQIPIALEIARLLAERAQLQASLQQVQKMDAVAELAGGVAHDFNNMLMVVKASLDTLGAHTELGNDITDELGVISQAADRAAQLTRRLLSFSRHQAAARSPVEVNALLAELEPILRRVVTDRVKVEIVPGPGVDTVQTDRAGLEQALVNLAVNARDAMPEGGTITITTSEVVLKDEGGRSAASVPGEYVLIAVADTGHGMSPEVLSRVFDPFFTTKPSGGGTGLGLTMVYAFAKNSGGQVTIESESGRGTTVKLHLPRSRATSASLPPPVAARSTRKVFRDDMAILVVDDDRFVRESIRRVLHRAGYRVLIADGAEEALAIVGRVGPQIALAVLDVMMPGMTGPELARRFVDLETSAKILFISGFAPGNLPVGVGEVTSEMLLQKPFAGAELLQRVGQLVEF